MPAASRYGRRLQRPCWRRRAHVRSATISAFFGDGFQKSKLIDGARYWRIPVMDGEFVVPRSRRRRQGSRRRQHHPPGRDASRSPWPPAAARSRRSATSAGRHHAVSRRRRPQRQQSRLALQEHSWPRRPTPTARRSAAAWNPRSIAGAIASTKSSSTASMKRLSAGAMAVAMRRRSRRRRPRHHRRQLRRQTREVPLPPPPAPRLGQEPQKSRRPPAARFSRFCGRRLAQKFPAALPERHRRPHAAGSPPAPAASSSCRASCG